MDERTLTVYRPEVEVLEPEEDAQASRAELFMAAFADRVAEQVRVAIGHDPVKLDETTVALNWMPVWEEWLLNDPRKRQPRPAATVTAYRAGWEDFRTFLRGRCQEWAVTWEMVRDWLAELRSRPLNSTVQKGLVGNGRREPGQVGLAEASVGQWLSAVSAFYSYAGRYEVVTPDGRRAPLFGADNPCRSARLQRPQPKQSQVGEFSLQQVQAILHTIQWEIGHTRGNLRKLRGLRNYALFLTYFYTGARNREIRILRWRDIRKRGSRFFWWKDNKGSQGWQELPRPAWEAIREFLSLAGRLATMQPDDFIFRAEGESAARFGALTPEECGQGPLSGGEVNRLLRKYCEMAGINPKGIHAHMTRHTAAMLYADECDGNLRDVQALLGHKHISTTEIYLKERRGQRNPLWEKLEDRLQGRSLFEGAREDGEFEAPE